MASDELDLEIERRLAALAQKTSDLSPADAFTEALIKRAGEQSVHIDPLEEVRRETNTLAVDERFTDAVMERAARTRVAQRKRSWTESVVRSGPWAVGFAAAAAAASVALFLASQTDVDRSLAASIDTVEVFE
ncbi:MAG: hypothetical protein IPK82_21775 [Polyangiaceae bacterium]|nr:hypothetical protein [Polyangiaceae bacterium]